MLNYDGVTFFKEVMYDTETRILTNTEYDKKKKNT
jgi:hypothetical protein